MFWNYLQHLVPPRLPKERSSIAEQSVWLRTFGPEKEMDRLSRVLKLCLVSITNSGEDTITGASASLSKMILIPRLFSIVSMSSTNI